jgi:hypothetical protein
MASLNPAVFRLALACLALWASSANADSTPEALPAATLHALDGMAPAGRWAARLTLLRNGYDHRFDDGKNRVDMDVDANAALAPFGVDLDSEVTTEFAELLFGYGVTENLTVGAIVPWARTTNRLRLAEAAPGGIAALRGTLAGLGYKPLGSRAVAGFSDPTLGALWRFHRSERDSAVLGFGVRMGLARDDDPDDLADIPPGDGSTDLRFRLEYFRDLGDGWDLRLLAEHQVQTPDDVAMRPGGPFSFAKEKLRRNLGDYQEFDIELGKSFGDWRVSGTWHRYQEAPDRYTSRIGTDTGPLSVNTDTLADQLRVGMIWSGIRAWREGRLFMPLIVKLEMQDAVRGRNFVDVRDVYLRITSFF